VLVAGQVRETGSTSKLERMRIVRIHIMPTNLPTRAAPTPLRQAGTSGPPDRHTGKKKMNRIAIYRFIGKFLML
jgi:hypothetical protein